MFLFCLVFAMSLCASVYMCFVVTCWERADLLALVCGVYCESVTFPLVSWVRCGTWLYRFLIFAPLLTLKKDGHNWSQMSRDIRFPTMWYVRPAKTQISLRIHAVCSEPLLVAWIFYACYATYWTLFGVSKLKRRLHRLVWVYTCQNDTLLEITCRCSN